MRKLFTRWAIMVVALFVTWNSFGQVMDLGLDGDVAEDYTYEESYDDLHLKSIDYRIRHIDVAIFYYRSPSGQGPVKSSSYDTKIISGFQSAWASKYFTFSKISSQYVDITQDQYEENVKTGVYPDRITGQSPYYSAMSPGAKINVIICDTVYEELKNQPGKGKKYPGKGIRGGNVIWITTGTLDGKYGTDYINTVCSHELGHNFGLYHTHEHTDVGDSFQELVINTVPSDKDVSIMNGEDHGDCIMDTPADPNNWAGGQYNPYKDGEILRDPKGDTYNPIVNNLMNYNSSIYRHTITDDQTRRAYRWWDSRNGIDPYYDYFSYGVSKTVKPFVAEGTPILPPTSSQMWSLTSTTGGVSINQSGVVTVSTVNTGTVSITCKWRYLNSEVPGDYHRSLTFVFDVNPKPHSPIINEVVDPSCVCTADLPLKASKEYIFTMQASPETGYPGPDLYEWKFLGPDGYTSTSTGISTDFTAPVAGTYTIKARVKSGIVYSDWTNLVLEYKPEKPSISEAYSMDDYTYHDNPLDAGVDWRFQMSNCGSSSSTSDYEWTYTGFPAPMFYDYNHILSSDGYTIQGKTCYLNSFGDANITLKARYRVSSSGAWSDYATKSLTFQGGFMMMMAPNPVSLSGESTISLMSTSEESIDYDEGWDLEVVDMNYSKKFKEKVKKKDYKLKTHGWKAGTYIVIAKYKDKTLTGKLKVE